MNEAFVCDIFRNFRSGGERGVRAHFKHGSVGEVSFKKLFNN